FSRFYQKYQVQTGDWLIVTIKPNERVYVFEHEPASKVRESLIQQRDREISGFIHKAIKRKKREDAREIIFQAYGNLAWLKEYPSSHWQEIVEKDDGLRLRRITPDYWEIASIDFRSMFDMLDVDETTERKLQKRRESIKQEIDDFLERLDAAYQAVTERLTTDIGKGGPDNVIVKSREPRDRTKLYEHSEKLIDKFFEAEKSKRENENTAGKKASDVAMLASYLIQHEAITLEEASFDDLAEFLFDWYPRKVINSSLTHAKQMVTTLRDFYRFLVERKVIRSAAFAEAALKLRDLVVEKIELYDRLPMEESGELYARLFSR